MKAWINYLKQGLIRSPSEDRIAGEKKYSDFRKNLKKVIPYIIRYRRIGLLAVFLAVFSALVSLPLPMITRFLIDKVILDKQMAKLLSTVLVLAGAGILLKLANTFQQFYFSLFDQKVTLDIQHDLLDRTLRFPKSFFDTQEVGYLMSRLLSDINGIRLFYSSTMVNILGSSLRFIGGIGLLFYLKWQLALAVVIILPSLFFTARYFAKKIRILSHASMEQHANVSRSVQESLSSSSLIKAFSSEKNTAARLMSHLKNSFQANMESSTVSSAAGFSLGVVPEIARLLVLGLGAFWVIRGDWTLGSLLAFQAYLGYVFGPAHFLANVNLQIQRALSALERAFILFDIVPEENLETGISKDHLKGEVEFKGVAFSYDGAEKVLEDVSFKVDSGDWVAVVGPSGVGKTTLLSLVLGFYRPTSGTIMFDGVPVSQYNLSSLRKRIGYVSQKPQLLSGTILENLRYGNPEAEDEKIYRAAKVSGIHDFIQRLSRGYDAKISEQGVNLSDGQKQRIALARALVKDPDILILDEPTAALDAELEDSIFSSLPEMMSHKTLFVVTHRLSTIKKAKYILVFNEKKLVAKGTHQYLVQNSKEYQKLVAAQEPDTKR